MSISSFCALLIYSVYEGSGHEVPKEDKNANTVNIAFLTMAANYQNDPLQSLRDSFPEGEALI